MVSQSYSDKLSQCAKMGTIDGPGRWCLVLLAAQTFTGHTASDRLPLFYGEVWGLCGALDGLRSR
jgi:hypothetical protein